MDLIVIFALIFLVSFLSNCCFDRREAQEIKKIETRLQDLEIALESV